MIYTLYINIYVNRKCKEMPQCQMFTVDIIFSICYLKTNNIHIKDKLYLISGAIKS